MAVAARTAALTQPGRGPRRFLAICHSLGFQAPNLFPEKAGRDYESTPYLDLIKRHRERYTIFSGVSHPEVDGGHFAEASFLTAAPHPKGHGRHLAFDRTNNYPLANAYVSMLQRLGIETDRFASGTGTMRGLELS